MVDWDELQKKQHEELSVLWKHHQLIPDNLNQANFIKLWASTPCWDMDLELRLMYLNVISREYPEV
jgi:hypothetical protein